MEPVVNEAAEVDSNVAKMLCQLDNHLGNHLFFLLFPMRCICINLHVNN